MSPPPPGPGAPAPSDAAPRPPVLRRLLAACRGPAALRLVRWAREAGVEVVVLMDDSDGDNAWPDQGDFACHVPDEPDQPWPAPARVLAAAMDAGCDLIHPGWGQAARSPGMVDQLSLTSLAWAGPGVRATGIVCDRAIAREHALEQGIAVVPGSLPTDSMAEGLAWVEQSGLPIMVKPVDVEQRAGHGVATTRAAAEAELRLALALGPVLLERRVVGAREVEVPLLMDDSGACWVLGDREIGTRGPAGRVVVESPAPGIAEPWRAQMHAAAETFARSLRFRGLGAVRFLVPPDGRPYFLQLRPGLQPWHGVTELRFGVDLVDAQVRIAMGEGLAWAAPPTAPDRHALWAALRAAAPGVVAAEPTVAADVRFAAGCAVGDRVRAGQFLGGLVVAAPTRPAALVRLQAAVASLAAEPGMGVPLRRDDLARLINAPAFWRGPLDRDQIAALLAGSAATGAPPSEAGIAPGGGSR